MNRQSPTIFQKDNQVKKVGDARNMPIRASQEDSDIRIKTTSEVQVNQMNPGMESDEEDLFSDEDFSDMEETEDIDEGTVDTKIRFMFKLRSG